MKSDYILRLDVLCLFWMWYVVVYTALCESLVLHLEVWILNELPGVLFPGPPLVGLQVSEAMYFECVVDS